MASKKPVIHGRDHLPGGSDPIPLTAVPATAPSVATFYFDSDNGDTALTVTAGSQVNIPWTHAELPSDGLITGPFTNDWFVGFAAPCITIEFLRTTWEDAGFNKLGALGTDDRIGFNDMFALANAGAGVHTATQNYGDSTLHVRPNAHTATDLIHGYVRNGDTGSRDVIAAFLCVFAWSAPGYTGVIPGYPE